ncbi:hypothetical protein VB776_05605 [Arcicella sp. DC2W]|uniref:Uncharacterized protein n=1 Tax=Arcicella gelida TaxID=2984195 RepID=A0ABU5S274_9BACT|nr:hypothetical protein [Arcicella sp. DC2W]MEA5402378.1 hypothetical protein [Arcicella sp. DC2W]
MSEFESSNLQLSGNKSSVPSNRLSLYEQYGSMAYGIILQIVPQKQMAQEIMVDLFNSLTTNPCAESKVSIAICIIRKAREIALFYKEKFDIGLSSIQQFDLVSEIEQSKIIFDLSFRQGKTVDFIAEKLNIPKAKVYKAISEYFKTFRQS